MGFSENKKHKNNPESLWLTCGLNLQNITCFLPIKKMPGDPLVIETKRWVGLLGDSHNKVLDHQHHITTYFFQLKTHFPILSIIWLYLNLFDFIWIYLQWDLPGVIKQYIAIHHVTSKCVLNPFIIEAQHLTTQGNMITADSWAAILPLASAKLL